MTLPAALTLIPLHGKILKADATGTPAVGTVSFRIEQTLRDTTDNVILTPTTLTATLDAAGAFTLSLPATDDPDVTPIGWTYVVTIVTDALHDTWRISIPAATVGTLELADIAPAVAPSTLVTYALASALSAETARATAAEALKVPTSRLITAGNGLAGGGDLSADRSLAVSFGGIAPVSSGTGTAGAAATPSRSDHAHPVNALAASDHALIAWNYPPYAATGAALAPASGTIYVVKIPIPAATTITNVVFGFNVAGATLTAGQNFAALYGSAKALLSASPDQTTSWGTLTGPAVIALSTPQAVAAGYVYAAFLSNGTTPPTLNRGIGNINNVGLTSATAAYATAGTGQTSMPGTITTTSYTAASIWAAVS